MSTALVLGGSGFIGSAILEKGLTEQQLNIAALEHKSALRHKPSEKLHVINASMDALNLEQYHPRYIIHAARQASARGRLGRLYKALGGAGSNKKLIRRFNRYTKQNLSDLWYVSGSLMYGNCGNNPVTENFPLQPISFARDYVVAEKPFLNAMPNNRHIHMVRVPWVFGNGSWFSRFYLEYMKTHRQVPLYGKGQNLMTFIDNEDLASVLWHAVTQLHYPVLNLFMPDYVTQENFALMLSELSGMPVHQIPEQELQQRYGHAVYEAFTSSIRLDSMYNNTVLTQSMRFKTVKEMLSERLPDFLA